MVPRLRQRTIVTGVSLVALVLPFDLAAIVWTINGHNIRPVHALVMVLLAVSLGALWGLNPPAGEIPDRHFDRLALALGGLLVLSTIFADQYQVVATVSLRRLLTGIALAMVVRRVVHTERDMRAILSGLVFGSSIACLLGFYILAGYPGSVIGEWFRGRTIMFGPTQRFTLPFPHANVAGVYLGASLILGLGLLVDSRLQTRVSDWPARLYGACCLILGVGLTLTYNRSAVFATIATLLVLTVTTMAPGWLGGGRFPSTSGQWIFGGALLLLVGGVVANPVWRSRVADPGNDHWYRVEILAPEQLTMTSPPTSVSVRNLSEVSWPRSEDENGLVAISLDDTGIEIGRSVFPLPAMAASASYSSGESGGTVLVDVSGLVVGERTTVIVWDVYRQGQGHFRGLTGQPVVASSVTGKPLSPVIKFGQPFRPGAPGLDPVPKRTQLWSAARSLAWDRALVGVGPGNFRLHYQEVLGINGPQATHAHSILFEPLASWGLPATALFLFLISWTGLRALVSFSGPLELVTVAAFASLVVANLADWTLASASGGLLFWLLLGLVSQISDFDDRTIRSVTDSRSADLTKPGAHQGLGQTLGGPQ